MTTFSHDATRESVAATPPVAVGIATLAGVSLQDWVFILTAIYLVVQIAYLIAKWRREVKRRHSADENA